MLDLTGMSFALYHAWNWIMPISKNLLIEGITWLPFIV
jgi:hypothetical protein